jgi:protocatechuate 3,4-dioxygenase beta subunit
MKNRVKLEISRRQVLIHTAVGAAGLLVSRSVARASEKFGSGARGFLPPTPQCLETEDNILGPYYRAGAPFRTILADPDEGQPLHIDGSVSGPDCQPLAGALLDLWQANDDGVYDLKSPDFLWRGRMNAGKDGIYSFDSILPGRYPSGSDYRPRHIHFMVSSPGSLSLTTQLYFAGDPYLKTDPYVRPSLIIELEGDETQWSGTFNIVLGAA